MTRPVEDLATRLGYDPTVSPELWRQALTHRSAEQRPHYERLEFLGDAVLKLVASEWLFQRFPGLDEGQMTKVRARAVSDEALARAARQLDLGPHIILGAAEKRTSGREKVGILASALEAVLGVVYLAHGYEAASAFLSIWLADEFEAAVRIGGQDNHKAVLQEWTQQRYKSLPVYRLVAESGPEHDRTYEIEVQVHGKALGVGLGKSKKSAEQAAAARALEQLGPDEQPAEEEA